MTAAEAIAGRGVALVMIVDDMPEVREVMGEVLREAGFLTVDACNGREAYRLLWEGAAPSVILLDLAMPIMDGVGFLQRAAPRVPVILMTGDTIDLPPRLPPCVVQILDKPVSADALVGAVREAMRDRLDPGSS